MKIMREIDGPPDTDFTADSAFTGYLVLDALIGNTDRHHQNWATLRSRSTALRLAPTFDHASSLGYLLSDEARMQRLSEVGPSVSDFAQRASTPFAGAQTPTDAALQALSSIGSIAKRGWRDRVLDSEGVLESVVACVPEQRMSQASRMFALALERHNRAVLLERWAET
jgi:hypothetical protein